MLNHTDAGGTGTGQVAARVQTDITEALHDEGLAAPAGRRADLRHIVRLLDEVVQPVEHTTSGGGHTAVNAALVDRLAGNARVRINIQMADRLGVRVRNPGHLALARSHVRGRHIDARADEALLGQLQRETAGNLLQLMLGVLAGIDLDTGLGATERYIHTGALERHQRGQGFHFIARHVQRETNTWQMGKQKDRTIISDGGLHSKARSFKKDVTFRVTLNWPRSNRSR